MASAIACDPSICFSIGRSSDCAFRVLLHQYEFMRLPGGGDISGADLARESLLDRAFDAVEANETGQGGKGAKQSRVRHRTPDMLQRKFGCRHNDGMTFREAFGYLPDMELGEGLVGVDQQIAVAAQAGEHVDHLEQRRVLHDQAVRLQDRLPQPDFLVGDAAERHHGSAGALGSKTRKSLGMPPFKKGRDREHLGPGDDPLSVPAILQNSRYTGCPPCARSSPERPTVGEYAASSCAANAIVGHCDGWND